MPLGRQRKRLAAGIAVAVLGTGVIAGCGGDDGSTSTGGAATSGGEAETVSVAMFPYAFGNPYSEANIEAAKAKAKELGVELELFDSGFDGAKQFNQVQDAVASGRFQGLLISPADGVSIAPAIEDAGAQGVPVVCFGSPCGSDPTTLEPQVEGQVAYVGVSADKDGEIQADLVAEACEGIDPCNVAYILGTASNTSETARSDALKAALEEHPSVKLVATVEGQFDRQESYKAAQNLLQGNADLHVIATGSDQMTLGAEQAAEEAGRDIALIGNAASAEGVEAVADGRWVGTSVWLPGTEAELGLELLVSEIRGEGIETPAVDVREESPIGDAVTQDNAKSFDAQWHN